MQRTYPSWFLRATDAAAIDCSAPPPRVSSGALRAISRLLPEEVRYEALEGLLKTRMSQHAHDKACRGYRASYLAASSLESLAGGQY